MGSVVSKNHTKFQTQMPCIQEEAEKRSLCRGWSIGKRNNNHPRLPGNPHLTAARVRRNPTKIHGDEERGDKASHKVSSSDTDREREKENFRVGWTVNEIRVKYIVST